MTVVRLRTLGTNITSTTKCYKNDQDVVEAKPIEDESKKVYLAVVVFNLSSFLLI